MGLNELVNVLGNSYNQVSSVRVCSLLKDIFVRQVALVTSTYFESSPNRLFEVAPLVAAPGGVQGLHMAPPGDNKSTYLTLTSVRSCIYPPVCNVIG